jgi:hypothetical protein
MAWNRTSRPVDNQAELRQFINMVEQDEEIRADCLWNLFCARHPDKFPPKEEDYPMVVLVRSPGQDPDHYSELVMVSKKEFDL